MGQEFNVIGKRGINRFGGYAKASGKATFTSDIILPGMLHAKILTSPYAHARIKSIDTSKAEALPGVKAVVTYKDKEIKDLPLVSCTEDCPVLGDKAYREGSPIGAAVAAVSEEIAEEALKLIDVEWEELPFILDVEEALKPDAHLLYPEINPDDNIMVFYGIKATHKDVFETLGIPFEKGDVKKAFDEAENIKSLDIRLSKLAHAGAEPQVSVARWEGDHLRIWRESQDPRGDHLNLSKTLSMPMAKIFHHCGYCGGSFGNTSDAADRQGFMDTVIPAILAKKTGKPVKLQYSRRDNFYIGAEDLIGHCKVGFKDNGLITAVESDVSTGGGEQGCYGFVNGYFAGTWIDELLKCPNTKCTFRSVWQNKQYEASFRCEHNACCFILNTILDYVADELGMDPTEVALINSNDPGHVLKECIDAGKEAIGWDEKWHKPGTKRLPNGKMHGIGFAWGFNWGAAGQPASAAVRICPDGTAQVIGAMSDVGVAPQTSYAMIAAEALGMRLKDVYMQVSGSDVGYTMQGASCSTCFCANGTVVKEAAEKAKKMLLERAAPKFGVTPEELDIKDSVIYVKAKPEKTCTIPDVLVPSRFGPPVGINLCPGEGNDLVASVTSHATPRIEPPYDCYQAHFCEVEVDTETGQWEIKRVVLVNDVGKAIYPESVNGQQYGGHIMGIGRDLGEEYIHDPTTGVLLNGDLLEYKIPTMLDWGPIETYIKESGLGPGPYGGVGIGEHLAVLTEPLISNAIYNAIGVRINDLPITPEKVLKALGKI